MRNWIRRSFKNRIFVTIFIVTLLPLLLCDGILMHMIITRTEKNAVEKGQEELTQITGTFDEMLTDYESFLEDFVEEELIRQSLGTEDFESKEVYEFLNQQTHGIRDYAEFYIYSRDGICRYSTKKTDTAEPMETDWGILYACFQTEDIVYQAGTQNGNPSGSSEGMMAAKSVRNFEENEVLGYVIVSLERDDLTNFFGSILSDANDLFLLDATWRTAYCTQPIRAKETVNALRSHLMKKGSLQENSDACYYLAQRSGRSGFTFIIQQPKIYTLQVIWSMTATSVAMGVLCLIMCLYGAWMLSRHLAEPVHQLDEAMQEVEEHNYQLQIQMDRIDEIGQLADSFNRMTAEYCRNLEQSVRRQKELDDVQLRMLHAQLNPHFLYNTLDSMKWLGITSQISQIADMSTNLAALLRMAISDRKMITVEEELDLVERYLDIQSIRYEDRFTCEIDVAEQFQHCMIPKLLLQPLVENAIIHGIVDMEEGYIKIFAEEKDGDMIISVQDNGCGMLDEVLQKVNGGQKIFQDRRGHLGLYNVGEIIRLNFGAGYGIAAQRLMQGGTRINVCLPMQRKEPEHAESIDCG